MTDFSNRPADKLQAAINHDWNDPDRAFAPSYVEACAQWFDGLSRRQRNIAAFAVRVFDDGSTAAAEKIARALPPAPKFPLSDKCAGRLA
jgi:hypothetical protein